MKDGGAAFPRVVPAMGCSYSTGMSLRDYFAGQALIGLLSNEAVMTQSHKDGCVGKLPEASYIIADDMIEERERQAAKVVAEAEADE